MWFSCGREIMRQVPHSHSIPPSHQVHIKSLLLIRFSEERRSPSKARSRRDHGADILRLRSTITGVMPFVDWLLCPTNRRTSMKTVQAMRAYHARIKPSELIRRMATAEPVDATKQTVERGRQPKFTRMLAQVQADACCHTRLAQAPVLFRKSAVNYCLTNK